MPLMSAGMALIDQGLIRQSWQRWRHSTCRETKKTDILKELHNNKSRLIRTCTTPLAARIGINRRRVRDSTSLRATWMAASSALWCTAGQCGHAGEGIENCLMGNSALQGLDQTILNRQQTLRGLRLGGDLENCAEARICKVTKPTLERLEKRFEDLRELAMMEGPWI
ncbi:hypothetical protein B0H19DRAFT_1085075 [Mycena capillaripes]|nr:hypothetical protein B0H19DRAFT_1085075 [Mycena capillaripes]